MTLIIRSSRAALSSAAIMLGAALPATADDEPDFNAEVDAALADIDWPGLIRMPIGVTPRGTLIWCLMDEDALDYRTPKVRAVFAAGLDGSPECIDACVKQLRDGYRDFQIGGDPSVAIIPIANPDAWGMRKFNAAEELDVPPLTFPPEGDAYGSGETSTAAYLWRFIGWFAPDVVVELLAPNDDLWANVPFSNRPQLPWPGNCLAQAVMREPVAGAGRCHGMRMPVEWSDVAISRETAVVRYSNIASSPFLKARTEDAPFSEVLRNAVARLDRTPRDVVAGLLEHYGDHLNTVMYQPALAVMARSRFGELTRDASQRRIVEEIVEPYLSGEKPSLGDRVSGSHLAGHLVFAELARSSGDPSPRTLVNTAADYAFDENGNPRESMPFHNEMSDAVFMACPILTSAGYFTGDPKYLDMALRHLEFMRDLCVRDDGLYRHSPLNEAAWGRGNGFPALGLALSLTDLEAILNAKGPDRDTIELIEPIRDEMLVAFRAHIAALAEYQDPTGMWRQIIDHPGSYRELTSTCMITFAILRALKHGWLDEAEYLPIAGRAWEAIKLRIAPNGVLFDVCTGTGRQNTLRDYLDRTAILGRDERGGAMALMVAVEMAEWQAGREPAE